MVARQAGKRKAVGVIISAVVAACLVGVAVFLVLKLTVGDNDGVESLAAVEAAEEEVEPVAEELEAGPLPEKVDFQSVVDEWAASVSGNRSVLIYDLERSEVVGAYNTTEDYNTASLYKLFVVYEGYRRVQAGEWQAEAAAGSTGHTILECLDLAIRESYSPCAETLWASIGHDTLDEIIEKEFKITGSDISGLTSNVNDIMAIMKMFYEHEEIKDEGLVARMKDSFLNQPATTYDWRQGLPSGFSDGVNVYNKVGWAWGNGQWNIYHDAAIVEFPEQDRHFIVVVMTNYVSHKSIADFGGRIEAKFLQG